MKKLFSLVIQDIKILFRNLIFYLIPTLAVLIIVIINWVIPAENEIMSDVNVYIYNSGSNIWTNMLMAEFDEENFVDSYEELKTKVSETSQSMGIKIEGGIQNPSITLVHRGTESEEMLKLITTTFEYIVINLKKLPPDIISVLEGKENIDFNKIDEYQDFLVENFKGYKTENLRSKSERVPDNKAALPPILILEIVLLGLMFGAIMIFQEKQEGSIKAYRITPGSTLMYIASKYLVNISLSLVYGFLIMVFTMGFTFNYLHFLILTLLASSLGTLIGLSISVFFKEINEFLPIMMLLLFIGGVPAISYFSPSFSPFVISIIPTYQIIFGYREILFPTGKEGFLLNMSLILLVENIVLFVISYLLIKFKLMRERG